MREFVKKRKLVILFFLPILMIILASFVFVKDFHLKYFKEKLEIEVGTPFLLKEFEVCYGNIFQCDQATFKLISKEIDTQKIGNYTIKYQLDFNGKEKEITQEIDIVDHTAPIIEIEENEIIVCPNNKIPDIKKKAIDNFDGDITNKIVERIENKEIVFEVTDSYGNTSSKKIKAKFEDSIFPEISLNGENYISIKRNSEYQDQGAQATDNCDGDITNKIKIDNQVNPKVAGEYRVIYSVKDSSGNETKSERIVYVIEEKKYIPPTGKNIYLTFDDGPSVYTGKLLDILKKYNVKVTFFVTNQGLTNGNDEFIKRAYEEGHTIGLHTYSHDYKTIYQSEEAYFNDLYAIQNKVKNITGFESKIIRFPGGSSNTISRFNPGIMSRLAKTVEIKGFRYFDWNLDSEDAGKSKTTSEVVASVIKGLGNSSNYVVLQHDIKNYSVDAVESIIQYGLSHGYQFKALTMDSPNMHHRLNN